MMNIDLYADGGPEIGYGHLSRSLNLYRAFAKAGYKLRFCCKEESSLDYLRKRGADSIKVDSWLGAQSASVLFVDKYNIDNAEELQLGQCYDTLIAMDDNGESIKSADIIINGGIQVPEVVFIGYGEKTQFWTGPDFNLVNPNYGAYTYGINKDLSSIIITTGGSDVTDFISRSLTMIKGSHFLKNFSYDVVIGPGVEKQPRETIKGVQYVDQPLTLVEVFKKGDLLISSAGSTLYEACVFGIPTLSFISADNQEKQAWAFDKKGLVPCLGHAFDIDEMRLEEEIKKILNPELREARSKNMMSFVDGKGAERIVDKFEKWIGGAV